MTATDTGDAKASYKRYSVAMTAVVEEQLLSHLLRGDGQEDLCLCLFSPSSGYERQSAILQEVRLPEDGERNVHGNVTFSGSYVMRVASEAASLGLGVAILHSHPGAEGWQNMSLQDRDAEASFSNLVREMTGYPLVGLIVAGMTKTWSARFWCVGTGQHIGSVDCESIRKIGETLKIDWNDRTRPPRKPSQALTRTISCWGSRTQDDISRLRILIVGLGTVGLEVAQRLSASGISSLGLLDFDTAKLINLDRMIGLSPLHVLLAMSKVDVADLLVSNSATSVEFETACIEGSVCEEHTFQLALDYDLIFCCVDNHPWPRSILNSLAYSDLIPVIDGGISIDAFNDGRGLQSATWRSHVLRPGRPCMACNGQLNLGDVLADREGLFEDKDYIAGLPPAERPRNQNVATLAASVSASLLAQFVSFVASCGGIGDPGPLRYSLATHWLEHREASINELCAVEGNTNSGDARQVLLGKHAAAQREIRERIASRSRVPMRLGITLYAIAGSIMRYLNRRILLRPIRWSPIKN